MSDADHYAALGLGKDATPEDVKRAYRARAQRAHPDRKGGDPDAFRSIQKAYDVLGDAERRARYDKGEKDRVDDPVSAQRREALQEIAKLLMTAINDTNVDLMSTNLIKLARQAIQARVDGVNAQIAELNAQIRRRETFLKRLRRKKSKDDDLVKTMVQHSIEKHRGVIGEAQNDIARCGVMRELLEDYDYATDLQDEVSEALAGFLRSERRLLK